MIGKLYVIIDAITFMHSMKFMQLSFYFYVFRDEIFKEFVLVGNLGFYLLTKGVLRATSAGPTSLAPGPSSVGPPWPQVHQPTFCKLDLVSLTGTSRDGWPACLQPQNRERSANPWSEAARARGSRVGRSRE